jgi:hypothetical protein
MAAAHAASIVSRKPSPGHHATSRESSRTAPRHRATMASIFQAVCAVPGEVFPPSRGVLVGLGELGREGQCSGGCYQVVVDPYRTLSARPTAPPRPSGSPPQLCDDHECRPPCPATRRNAARRRRGQSDHVNHTRDLDVPQSDAFRSESSSCTGCRQHRRRSRGCGLNQQGAAR